MIEIIQIIQDCNIHDTYTPVLAGIVQRESGGNPYVIGVNVDGKTAKVYKPKTKEEAIQIAFDLEKSGKNFDSGFAQINSKNIKKFNLMYSDIFDTCQNLRVSANILYRNLYATNFDYEKALSMYNTGSPNSEVGKIYAKHVLENINIAKTFIKKMETMKVAQN